MRARVALYISDTLCSSRSVLSVKGCYQSGYVVIGATALTTVGLCLI